MYKYGREQQHFLPAHSTVYTMPIQSSCKYRKDLFIVIMKKKWSKSKLDHWNETFVTKNRWS